MIFDKCGSDSLQVLDSRHYELGVRRRRKCRECGHRVTTREMSEARMEALDVDGAKWRRMKRYMARMDATRRNGHEQ